MGRMANPKWHRVQQRTMMHRRGVESVYGDTQIVADVLPGKPTRAQIKAKQRAELEAAVATYTGPIKKIPAGRTTTKRKWSGRP
jgi:hypothetical protein